MQTLKQKHSDKVIFS